MYKTVFAAAGALLFSTSALAWAPSTPSVGQEAKAPLPAKGPGLADAAKSAAPILVAKSNDLPRAETVSSSWLVDDGLAAPKEDAKAIDTSQGDPDLDLTEQPAPLETPAAATAPQPATGNYPACRPGPGDDNCIQLYEPGVQTALASWTQPTGGLAGDTRMASAEADSTLAAELGESTETGMGGPYEPVADDLAMNGDGVVDENLGETEEAEL